MKKQIFTLILAMITAMTVMAQTSVHGVVTSAGDDEPMIGVSVMVKGLSLIHI